jgi:hypothetical protein
VAAHECNDRIAYLKEFRQKVRGVLDGSLPASDVASYSYGDLDGNQSTHRRGPDYFWNLLEKIDKKIDELEQRASGAGIRTHGMNRYGGGL